MSRYGDDDDDDDDDDGHDDPDDDFDETVDDDHFYTTTRRLLRYYTDALLWGHQRRLEGGEGGMGGRQAVEPLRGWRTVKGGIYRRHALAYCGDVHYECARAAQIA